MNLGFRYSQPTLGLFVWGFIYPGWLMPRNPYMSGRNPYGICGKGLRLDLIMSKPQCGSQTSQTRAPSGYSSAFNYARELARIFEPHCLEFRDMREILMRLIYSIPVLHVLNLILPLMLSPVSSSQGAEHVSWPQDRALTRVAFGSCVNEAEHPMLEKTLTLPFDMFILLGDNIYADTTNAQVMASKYEVRKNSSFFKKLRARGPVLATWDDHDFGLNDAGSEYPMKRESQRLFLDFMDEPADSPRRQREGVYDAYQFGPVGKRVQIILLDTRYFRGSLATGENNVVPSGGRYIPHPDPEVKMLGEAQWKWLENELKKTAEIRIIGSSIQYISEFSGGEAWANMPREKQRMLDLLKSTKAGRVLFISGDRHWAELSRMDRGEDHPLYDLTSSALTEEHKRGTPTPNRFRDGPTFHDTNVGVIQINWDAGPALLLSVIDQKGNAKISRRIVY